MRSSIYTVNRAAGQNREQRIVEMQAAITAGLNGGDARELDMEWVK